MLAKFNKFYSQGILAITSGEGSDADKKFADAGLLNDEGIALHAGKEYDEAIAKYQQAIATCPSERVDAVNMFNQNMAFSTQELGLKYAISKNFTDAEESFKKAHQILIACCKSDKKYEADMNLAEAKMFNVVGLKLCAQGNFSAALLKFGKAVHTCPTDRADFIDVVKKSLDHCSKMCEFL